MGDERVTYWFAVRHRPQLDGAAAGRRGHQGAVRVHCDTPHLVRGRHVANFPAGLRIPDSRGVICAAGDDPVLARRNHLHPVRMPGQRLPDRVSGSRVPSGGSYDPLRPKRII